MRAYRRPSNPNRVIIWILSAIFGCGISIFIKPGESSAQQFIAEVETGGLWFSRNDVRIPNEEGTLFDMTTLTGTDPAPFLRLRLNLMLGDRHLLRVLYAPVEVSGSGQFEQEVFFEESTFQPDIMTEGTYQFNTYRLTYRYMFLDSRPWRLGAGAAVLVRDAEVKLEQEELTERNTDLGVVPLVHLFAERYLTENFSLSFDAETLAGPQGRATDAAIAANFAISNPLSFNIGYRVIEGGADVGEVYNFAWINFGFIGITGSL